MTWPLPSRKTQNVFQATGRAGLPEQPARVHGNIRPREAAFPDPSPDPGWWCGTSPGPPRVERVRWIPTATATLRGRRETNGRRVRIRVRRRSAATRKPPGDRRGAFRAAIHRFPALPREYDGTRPPLAPPTPPTTRLGKAEYWRGAGNNEMGSCSPSYDPHINNGWVSLQELRGKHANRQNGPGE